MKKLIILCTALCIFSVTQAQKSAIDDMFDKYSEREGFTSISISSKLLSLFAPRDGKREDGSDIITRLKSIRILSVEDSTLNLNLNFYKELTNKLNLSVYEELMEVREGGDVTRFLIRQSGDTISELLVITGGPNNNALIFIKGDLDLKALSELSRSTGIEELKSLEEIEKKHPE
ncbi:MAG: DUF4252 domain-containing protein [Bacteroidales bacterium]|nr:DUF4252 domain-containing protein [Bacteroidales bacterium]